MKKHYSIFVMTLAICAAVLLGSGCTPAAEDTPSTGAMTLEVIETEQVTDLSEDATSDRG